MPAEYDELLETLIQHVTELKDQGVRHLPLAPDAVAALETLSVRSASAPIARAHGGLRTSQTVLKPIPAPKTPAIPPAQPSLHPNPSSAAPTGVAVSPEAKVVAMAELRSRALVCQKCPHLVRSRKNVVFGVGDINSPLMFVGEAPGADEDLQGEPFVGRAGQLLTRIIQTMGFSRDTVYIANILKCRPDTPGQTAGNRKPTLEEMKTCLPYLLEQIDWIRPKVIVALGATAVEGLLGKTLGITKLRGHFQSFRGFPLMPTYHPSYLLRNQAMSVKREVWEDMLQVMERLAVPITEKHRNYFLEK